MKKFVETLMELKSTAAFIFAGQIMVFSIVQMGQGLGELPLARVWQSLAIAVITALLQYVCFSDAVIHRMRYALRILLFSVPMLLLLMGFAFAFQWFPTDSAAAWAIFAGIYLFVLGALTTAFEIYFRLTGKRYQQRLETFRSEKK